MKHIGKDERNKMKKKIYFVYTIENLWYVSVDMYRKREKQNYKKKNKSKQK